MIMRNTLIIILAVLARLTLVRYKPKVVCVTGNVGKTSAKDAITAVVAARFFVRKSEKNYNTEVGIPMTILGMRPWGRNAPGWLWDALRALFRLVWTRYPEVLVLEMGVDRPGEMDRLVKIVAPDIAVFTASGGDMPVHVEFFEHPDALHAEKRKLAAAVKQGGTVVVNADEAAWKPLRGKADGMRRIAYGFSRDADVVLAQPDVRFDATREPHIPLGITVKVQYNGSVLPMRLDGTVGAHGAYAAGAACGVGLVFGINLADIAQALGRFVPPQGRLSVLAGVKGTVILDDTYNASPASTQVALDTLRSLPGTRKLAVLGDMRELGGFSEEAHRTVGKCVSDVCDVAVLVGAHMKFAEDELVKQGFVQGQNLFWYDTSAVAGEMLVRIIKEGDVILVKGSHSMHMEKVVERIRAAIV
ncbi:MAG: UDP-N-acetylmuramoyl-tripeptide--D-alanyl-D-alanine ligase [Patescibacteria group bacterium]